jgi:hypothetical protein
MSSSKVSDRVQDAAILDSLEKRQKLWQLRRWTSKECKSQSHVTLLPLIDWEFSKLRRKNPNYVFEKKENRERPLK